VSTYRLQVLAPVPADWVRGDLLAHVVSGIGDYTQASVTGLARGPHALMRVAVTFDAADDDGARAAAACAVLNLPVASDILLDHMVGRKYERIKR
jgi:hypothetical protein